MCVWICGCAKTADIVSCIQFDDTGDFLAAGDKGGRIVVFERSDQQRAATSAAASEESERRRHRRSAPKAEYKFFAEFQSHEPEFDCLKSMEIEERINRIRFLPRANDALMMLTTNDKTVKLWKVFAKTVSQTYTPPCSPGSSRDESDESESESDGSESDGSGSESSGSSCGSSGSRGARRGLRGDVVLPEIEESSKTMTAMTKMVYANAHAYHINSVGVCSDQQTFLSADDLRINLWALDSAVECFNVVDIKPENMEELLEVITCAEFHPRDCALFAYSTSKGLVRVCDLRSHALCDRAALTLAAEEDPSTKSFLSEIISSISDIKYSADGRYMLTRDYMALRLWDVAMPREPVRVVNVHEHLRPHLCELCDNEHVFDKFECALSYDCSQMVTGSYSRRFKAFDVHTGAESLLTANRVQPRHHRARKNAAAGIVASADAEPIEDVDFARKVLHLALHPTQNILAATVQNNLFIFS